MEKMVFSIIIFHFFICFASSNRLSEFELSAVNQQKFTNRQAERGLERKSQIESINYREKQSSTSEIENRKPKFNQFKLSRNLNENQRKSSISNAQRALQTITPTSNSSVQYIKNGDFLNSTCLYYYCVWNTSNYQPLYVAFWLPYPEMQIGFASYYLAGPPTAKVLQLAAVRPTCVRQLVQNLPSGIYELKYDYAARFSILLTMAQIYVYFNNTRIDTRMSTTHAWNNITVPNITIENDNTSFYLVFCGNSSLTFEGNLLGFVSLKKVKNLPVVVPPPPTNNLPTNTTTNSSTNTNVTSNQTSNTSTTTNKTSTTNSSNSNTSDSKTNTTTTSTDPQQKDSEYQSQYPSIINIDSLKNKSLDEFSKDNVYIQMDDKQFQQYLMKLLTQTMSNPIASNAFKLPAIRKIFSTGFSFFANLDHLWLYIYHKRQYSAQLNSIFLNIHNFQQSKWNFIPNTIENNYLHFPQIQDYLDQKIHQTPKQFLAIQAKSRSFLLRNFKFFLANIPLVVFIFFIGKFLHRIFSRLTLPQILKDFSRNSFLIILLLQGNCQSFIYFLLSEMINLFSEHMKMKILNITSVTFLFTLIFILIAVPFILRSLYENKRNEEFYDKCKNNLRGAVFYMIEFGLYNILLGSLHILCENTPQIQLIGLLCLEILFIFYAISNFIVKPTVYQSKLTIWIMILASIVRKILIFSYMIYQSHSESLISQLDKVQENCMVLYTILLMMSLAHLAMNIILTMTQIVVQKTHFFCAKRIVQNANTIKETLKTIEQGKTKIYQIKKSTTESLINKPMFKKRSIKNVKDRILLSKDLPKNKSKNDLQTQIKLRMKRIQFRPIFQVVIAEQQSFER